MRHRDAPLAWPLAQALRGLSGRLSAQAARAVARARAGRTLSQMIRFIMRISRCLTPSPRASGPDRRGACSRSVHTPPCVRGVSRWTSVVLAER
ncbi:hypothetical protein PsYK624_005350 [Phanerochaete sordida]|uniref:Uncharacterized protein n=1 Tax=Phanerochaete sordida TaxID=48140 RepID=A0A9P3L7G4_9APHY|nr:hypothetical protein PsYK624_005350 [Phanerochaete sordida]